MMTKTDGQSDGIGRFRPGIRSLRLLAALAVVNVLLLIPWWVLVGGIQAPWFAIEAGVVVGGFAMLPRVRATRVAAWVAAAGLLAFLVVGIGNSGMWLSLGRPLNLYVDIWVLRSVGELLVGTLGSRLLVAVLVGALVVVAVLLVAVVASLLVPAHSAKGHRSGTAEPWWFAARLGALVGIGWVSLGLTFDRLQGLNALVDAPAVRLAREQARRIGGMLGERERFLADLTRTPASYEALPGLLSGLQDRDVILAFVESYGATVLYDDRYAPVVGPRLDDFASRMAAAGLHVVSGKLVAPSQGGQSWYGHGSMLSGVWLDNQVRYDLLLASDRETLVDDFERAGHRTVALMPAISRAWPEGIRFGYDEIYALEDIDYRGPALNWVTMPDQFTWSFFQRKVRETNQRPVFAELGLISSHAPWTPILPVLEDWDSIGDGEAFGEWAGAGEEPETLWLDTDRVREHYARSVEYALHTVVAYAERHVDQNTLLIVLGDHQPAPLITGPDVTWEVPVHIVSGDPSLVEPFLTWGFIEGTRPDPAPTTTGMDYFRDWFVRAYSGPTDG